MPGFKFPLESLVAFKTACAEAHLGHFPKPFLVLEQRTQICPGGEQRHYLLRVGDDKLSLFNEIELVSWDSKERKAALDHALAHRDAEHRRLWPSTARVKTTEKQETGE